MFQNNQRQFYRELNQEGERCDDDQPDAEESRKFCGDIQSECCKTGEGRYKQGKFEEDSR